MNNNEIIKILKNMIGKYDFNPREILAIAGAIAAVKIAMDVEDDWR